MPNFRKKPVVIEARQYTGGNDYEIISWAHQGLHAMHNAIIAQSPGGLSVRTLEDRDNIPSHFASPGDWIIKGVKGEFYPCKPDIFEATYEPA